MIKYNQEQQRIANKIQRNLKQTINRAKKNKNPLKIGKDIHGHGIYIKGKSAQRERMRIAKATAQYKMSSQVDKTRSQTNESYYKDARNLNFKSREQYNQWIHWHNATAQKQLLNDRANSIRQSFRTRAEENGISEKVMNDFQGALSKMSNNELLRTINENSENQDIKFNDTFDSDQDVTDYQVMEQTVNMYRLLGIADKAQNLTTDDINSGYVDNRNWVNYDYDQELRKQKRREMGRV